MRLTIYTKFIVCALFLATIQLTATPGTYSKENVTSGEILETIAGVDGTLKSSHALNESNLMAQIYSVGSQRHPREILLVWQHSGRDFRLAHKIESFAGETFQKPELFKVNEFEFINITTEPAGSAGFVNDTMLWIAPDGTLHEVEFRQASEVYEGLAEPGQIALTGGEKEFFYEDGTMKFEFALAAHGDPHCCPSGGIVSGNYKLVGEPKFDNFTRKYKSNFQLKIDDFQYTALRTR